MLLVGRCNMSTIGTRLKQLRDSQHWTLKQVADKLGLKGHSTYSNWEYDRTQPDADMFAKLSELYKVSVDYLISGMESDYDDFEKLDAKRRFVIEEVHHMTDDEVDHFHDYIEFLKKNKKK